MEENKLTQQLDDVEPEKITLFEQFDIIMNGLTAFKTNINVMQQQIKILEKSVKKEMKILKKESEKNKIKGNKAPSGFAKPTKVTSALCEFMNKKEGSEIARTDVTKALIEYINKNNLQYSENKQIILPDEKLKTLLGIDGSEKVTYFTLQKYMNKHFIKEEAKQSSVEL
jgi:chromatin remodeling complex protein RSC6